MHLNTGQEYFTWPGTDHGHIGRLHIKIFSTFRRI